MALAEIGLWFVVCSTLIVWSGVNLARYGDVIAQKTGLGGTWMGLLVMAAVTSLPELIAGASSILVFDVPDIAAGDAIGSCMFNLLILAMLDARDPQPLTSRVHQGHVLSAAFGIVQFGLAAFAILVGTHALRIGFLELHAVVLVGVYAFAMRAIFSFERTRVAELAEELPGRTLDVTLRRAVFSYAAFAAVIVAAATMLPGIGERLANAAGLGQSFVGNVFIAASTSLPEVVVSIAAVRIGALNMAAANLFGSNLFNIAVLGVDEILYTRGSLLAIVSSAQLIGLCAAITMTGVAIVALTLRAQRKRLWFSWDAIAMIVVYVLAIAALRRVG